MPLINREGNSKASGKKPVQIKGVQTAGRELSLSEGSSAGTPRCQPAARPTQENL